MKTTKILAAILASYVSLSALFTPVCAAPADDATAEAAAEALNDMGLLRGTGNGFDLGSVPTRAQSAVMLVRFLGKEREALERLIVPPFTDVPGWARPYVGWLYENGLVNGYDESTYGAEDPCTAGMYATIVLRLLGYDDKNGDFSYSGAVGFADGIGLITDTNCDTGNFLRRDMVTLTYQALTMPTKDGKYERFADKLAADGTIFAAQAMLVRDGLYLSEPGLSCFQHDNGQYTVEVPAKDGKNAVSTTYSPDETRVISSELYESGKNKKQVIYRDDGVTVSSVRYDNEKDDGYRLETYDAAGWLSGTVEQTVIGTRTVRSVVKRYNSDGKTLFTNANILYYNTEGQLTKSVHLDDNDKEQFMTLFGYDSEGRMLTSDMYYMDGRYMSGNKNHYESGHLVRTDNYNGEKELYEYIVYEYDSAGNQTGKKTVSVK